MNVSGIIVTRGDVDVGPVVASLPLSWEVLVWNNGDEVLSRYEPGKRDELLFRHVPDESVWGRYEATAYAAFDLIYVQDDDAIVSNPQAIVRAWEEEYEKAIETDDSFLDFIVCNMPERFRANYEDPFALVGFGAAFHRETPWKALASFRYRTADRRIDPGWFARECDLVVTGLTKRRVLVDVEHRDREFASAPNRLWRDPEHGSARKRMRDLIEEIT